MKIDFSKLDFSKPDQVKAAFEALVNENVTLTKDLDTAKVDLQKANTAISEKEMEAVRAEVLDFCESEEMKTKIIPADKEKFVAILINAKSQKKIDFSAGDKKEEFDVFEFLKAQFKLIPDQIDFSELAHNESANQSTNTQDYKKTGERIAGYVK